MFKVGSIRKIEVTNFVTYSHVEFIPGPNLNMLIGPNGTGKSTLVAAIILGLGGNPKTVGRGTKVSEYVKHNCDKATIHIHLQKEQKDNDFDKITRIVTVQDKTTWFLNNVKVTLKDVIDCTRNYNIQIDNLCQFLPQDRVQDFAKLNQQELLKETQIALCKVDLIEKQEELVDCRNNQKLIEQEIEKNGVKLGENKDANLRLEGKIENFSKKKDYLKRIGDLDRKTAWMEYDEKFENMTDIKNDLNNATQIFEKHRNEAKPIEKDIQNAKKVVGELQHANSNVTRSMKEHEVKSRTYLENIEHYQNKIRDVQSDMNERIALIHQKSQEVETMATKIGDMKKLQMELVHKCGNDEAIQQKTLKLTNEIQKFQRHVTELQIQKDDLITKKHSKGNELRAKMYESSRLEDVKQQRLNYLQRTADHAYQAVLWLRNNKQLFKGEVYEPIMLELNVLDPKMAVYVESVIPKRDRIAFTCTDKDDMNSLIDHLRNEKRLTVNVIYSPAECPTPYRPTIPIEQLRKYSLYTYVHSLFTSPAPIYNYLCKTYGIHNIPVGRKETNKHFEVLPNNIRSFFSDTIKYSVSYSNYTNAKSICQNEIFSDGGLSISMDVLQVESLKTQIEELRNAVSNCDSQSKDFDHQIDLINGKATELKEELRNIRNVKQQAQTIGSRIAAMERQVAEMRQNPNNVDEIRKQATGKIKRIVRAVRQVAVDLRANYKSLSSLSAKSSLNLIKIEKARRLAAYLENKNEEARRLMKETETVMNNVKDSYAQAKMDAKAALQKAKSLSNNYTPDDEGFDAFREVFESLEEDLEKLQEEKVQLLAKIDCLNTADDNEMREYEERIHNIENLQQAIDVGSRKLAKITCRMDRLEEDWLTPLRHLVSEINMKFASAFERMGCAGEISINSGDDKKDFSKYGLCIKVTYRNGEPLQELNSVVQSGGERAVATAVFMLSLQELTPVPFRCVDEINQGMDAENERRIFQLLMESTGQAHSAQYFLITPKLIPNLIYSRHTMVHIIHNGPFVEADRKWSTSSLCNPEGVMLR